MRAMNRTHAGQEQALQGRHSPSSRARTSRGYRSAEALPVRARMGSGTEVAQYMQRSLGQ